MQQLGSELIDIEKIPTVPQEFQGPQEFTDFRFTTI